MTEKKLEIERKFLIGKLGPFSVERVTKSISSIVQTFITPTDPETVERVRQRRYSDDSVVYTHTIKKHVESGVNEETERGVPFEEYGKLLLRADPECLPIRKIRRVLAWEGSNFEVDTFSHELSGLILLEIELPSLDAPFTIPPFIPVIREVTGEKEYGNWALSKKARARWASLEPTDEPVKLVTAEEIKAALKSVPAQSHPRWPRY